MPGTCGAASTRGGVATSTSACSAILFYHLKLRCFVVIDLKVGAFKAEYAGKMNLYLNLADDTLRRPSDHPSIWLILCQDQKRILAEYALRGMDKPIGVSEYELTRAAC